MCGITTVSGAASEKVKNVHRASPSQYTLHTLHFELYTWHSTLPPLTPFTLRAPLLPNSDLKEPHSTLPAHVPKSPFKPSKPHAPHFTLYTLQPSLHTPHSTVYTLHFTLYTAHSTLYTLHLTLYSSLPAAHLALHAPYFTPHTLHFTPHTLHFALDTLYSTLDTLRFTHHTLHSTLTLRTRHYFKLYTWHSTLPHLTPFTLRAPLLPNSYLEEPHSTLPAHVPKSPPKPPSWPSNFPPILHPPQKLHSSVLLWLHFCILLPSIPPTPNALQRTDQGGIEPHRHPIATWYISRKIDHGGHPN